MAVAQYHGDRNCMSAQPYRPQRQSTLWHRKQQRKQSSCTNCQPIFSAPSQINHPASTIYCDSQSTIHLIRNLIYHVKKKHIEMWFHHIRELVTEKKLEVRKIDTEVNIVDCLTKPLPNQRLRALRNMMGLQQATEQKGAKRTIVEGKSKIDSFR